MPLSDQGKFPPVLFVFQSPVVPFGDLAGTERRLQGIEIQFAVAAILGQDDYAWARESSEHCGAKKRTGAAGIVEKHIESVVSDEACAFNSDVSSEGFRGAEQGERLIEQMWGKVKENAAAGGGLFAPGARFGRGAVAVIGGFETNDTAKFAGLDNFAQTLEIRVETAIVVDGKDTPEFFRQLNQGDGFTDIDGEGLVHDDVFAGVEGCYRQRVVGLVGRGDDDEAKGVDGEKFV